jgi:hypothetical protein
VKKRGEERGEVRGSEYRGTGSPESASGQSGRDAPLTGSDCVHCPLHVQCARAPKKFMTYGK